MATSVDFVEPKRRLDRSLDKPHFKNLPNEDRNLVYQLRNAIEGVHNKVETLKDGIDDRDRDISREQTLRKAAEERLDKLVDMYGDPAVTQELNERLPRAGKTNNRDKWQRELDDMSSLSKGRAVSFEDIESQIIADDSPMLSKSRSKSAEGRKHYRRRAHSSDGESDSEYRGRRHSPRHHDYPYHPPTASQYAMPPYPPPPFPGYYAAPPMMMAPQMMYPAAVSGQAPVNGAHPTASTPVQSQVAATTGASNLSASEQEASGVSASAALLASMSAAVEKEVQDNSKERELNRRISMLLAELDSAKELNEKLQANLNETEKELAAATIKQQTREAELEAEHTGKITALVEEIYAAQKQRDAAMLDRLRTANEERDEALLKLKQLHASLEQLDIESVSEELNMKQLVSKLRQADSSESISRDGRSLVDAINTALRRHKLTGVEEMRAVLQDRDNAVTQTKRLEAELLRVQRQMAARESEQDDVSTVHAKLLATQQERDIVLAKCNKLEEEIQTLQVYYSLHKSLSQEANLRDQFNSSLENLGEQLKERDSAVEQVQRENERLMEELDMIAREKQQLMEELHSSQDSHKHAAANELKLERLVNVLRRKIKGLGTGDD